MIAARLMVEADQLSKDHIMPRKRIPKYPSKPHSSGQARIQVNGKRLYMGKFGSPESYDAYECIVAAYKAGGPVLTERTLTLSFSTPQQREQFRQLAENLGTEAEQLGLELIQDFLEKHPEQLREGRWPL